ncbi:MAG: 4Fe-4S binding protein [Planctomycetota bacterium]
MPTVTAAACTGCGACAAICRFNAIAVVKRQAMVFPELCHACGGCSLACPTAAITPEERVIGSVEQRTIAGVELVTGRLAVGHPAAPPVIHATRDQARGELAVIDAPPGTSCAAAAAIRGVDHVVLVTEPTPFGLHDLRLAVEMARQLELPLSVVVNRSDIGDQRVHDWCASEAIAIIGEIPYNRRLAEAYARGLSAVSAVPALTAQFRAILDRLDTTTPTGGTAR